MLQLLALLLCIIATNQVRQIWLSTKITWWVRFWDILSVGVMWFMVLCWKF